MIKQCMCDMSVEEILENEITDEDYQYTEKGFEPKSVTKKFNKEFNSKEKDEKKNKIKRTFELKIGKADFFADAFGAYKAGSVDKPEILINLFASISTTLEHNDITLKEILIETIMHEFGHFLEELFEKEFDEDLIHRITEEYLDKYSEKKDEKN